MTDKVTFQPRPLHFLYDTHFNPPVDIVLATTVAILMGAIDVYMIRRSDCDTWEGILLKSKSTETILLIDKGERTLDPVDEYFKDRLPTTKRLEKEIPTNIDMAKNVTDVMDEIPALVHDQSRIKYCLQRFVYKDRTYLAATGSYKTFRETKHVKDYESLLGGSTEYRGKLNKLIADKSFDSVPGAAAALMEAILSCYGSGNGAYFTVPTIGQKQIKSVLSGNTGLDDLFTACVALSVPVGGFMAVVERMMFDKAATLRSDLS